MGLKDPALCQMFFPPVSNPLKASSSVGLRGFEGSISPFFGENQRCFCQTLCPVLGSGLCTCVPVAAGRPRQSHGTATDSASSFSPFPNHFLVWDSNCSLVTGIFPAQLHRAMKEKPVPGRQPLNPLGCSYQTSHQHLWGIWGTLGKSTSHVGGVRLQALSSPQHLCPHLSPSVPPTVMPQLLAERLGSLPRPAFPELPCCL